ncbi:MAG: kelch repeat-containing protein [Rhodothermales bacterium]|nr:kelch repeat-containing protein [Rhodothermales bacterium]
MTSKTHHVLLAIAAGFVCWTTSHLATAQPAGSWEAVETPNSPEPRFESGFVEVGGRMYMIGGLGNPPAYTSIYDPQTNTWNRGANVPELVHHFQAVPYAGKIYVAGAWTDIDRKQVGISHVWVYDPAADTWTQGPEIPEHRRRGGAGAIVYDDHLYLIAGNVGGHGPPAEAKTWLDRMDLATGNWEELPDAPHRRDHFQAAVVDGRIYAAAGRTSDVVGFIDSTVAVVDVYDIAKGSWSSLNDAPIPTERAGTPTAAVGKYIVVAGGEGFGKAWSETEALDTETGTWHVLDHLNIQRHGTQMFYFDGALWIAGGSSGQGGTGTGRRLVDLEVFRFGE